MGFKGGKFVIDATKRGNIARFVNSSCEPNCIACEWESEDGPRIILQTVKEIREGHEITIDYMDALEKRGIQCLCLACLRRIT